jgi:hypothetical protein
MCLEGWVGVESLVLLPGTQTRVRILLAAAVVTVMELLMVVLMEVVVVMEMVVKATPQSACEQLILASSPLPLPLDVQYSRSSALQTTQHLSATYIQTKQHCTVCLLYCGLNYGVN